MRTREIHMDRMLRGLHRYRWVFLAGTALAILALSLSWLVGLATAPAHYAGKMADLTSYGVPNVEIRLVYPTRLSTRNRPGNAETITIYAQSLTEPENAQPLDIILPLPDEAIAFVDRDGAHIPGRLQVIAGYPDPLPYNLQVIHANTQLQGTLLRSYRVNILPIIRINGQTVTIPKLAFQVRLESVWEYATRTFAASFFSIAAPYLLLGFLILLAIYGWQSIRKRQHLTRDKQLAISYSQLREYIKLEQWADARQQVESIRLVQPRYRDVDQLDTLISSAETAAWRREQLYRNGVQAYKNQDWPAAVHAFTTIESETPYYRDVRFLRQTAALYVDLRSRDRSRRTAAARDLGQIADLVDYTPLLRALGDHSEAVANTAEESFRTIGLTAIDVLLMGLIDDNIQVRERSYRLLEQSGQSARDQLLAGLRSSSPQLTKQVARLLVKLGVRDELAHALLWVPELHLEGIVTALLGEGVASTEVLTEALIKAPPERQQTVINALRALRVEADIDRRLEEIARSIKDTNKRDLIQQALKDEPISFRVGESEPANRPELEEAVPPQVIEDSKSGRRRLRPKLLDKRAS